MKKKKVVDAEYTEAALHARRALRSGMNSAYLKRTVAEAERLAPKGPERDFWSKVIDVLSEGKSIRTKEL